MKVQLGLSDTDKIGWIKKALVLKSVRKSGVLNVDMCNDRKVDSIKKAKMRVLVEMEDVKTRNKRLRSN